MEEAPLQVACLLEIATRREKLGLPTYAAFVDLRKAYDMVPHELLFLKLESIGIRGHMLSFLRALYRDSTFRVRTGKAPGILSEPILLRRGLRQGCPASPVLFNLFINDIFEGVDHLGCEVPGSFDNSVKTSMSQTLIRIPGLLYADDAVAIARSLQCLQHMLNHLSSWANDHFMQFGVMKCGVMAMGVHSDMEALQSQSDRWKLGGEQVPVVSQYRYLGTMIHRDLQLKHITSDRLVKGKRALASLSRFLSSKRIPIVMRILSLKTFILPIFTYAGEIWGMVCGCGADKLQTILNRTLRNMIGLGRGDSGVALAPIYRELGVPPIKAIVASARARAYHKASNIGSYFCHLVGSPFEPRHMS